MLQNRKFYKHRCKQTGFTPLMSVNFQHKVNCHPFAFYLKTLLVHFIHCVMYRLKELNDIKGAKIEELRRQIDEEVGKEQMES